MPCGVRRSFIKRLGVRARDELLEGFGEALLHSPSVKRIMTDAWRKRGRALQARRAGLLAVVVECRHGIPSTELNALLTRRPGRILAAYSKLSCLRRDEQAGTRVPVTQCLPFYMLCDLQPIGLHWRFNVETSWKATAKLWGSLQSTSWLTCRTCLP